MRQQLTMKSGIPYTVRHSKRAKRVSLKVSARNGVELVLPLWVTLDQVASFVAEREEWVRHAWDKYAGRREFLAAQPMLPEQVELAFSNQTYGVYVRACVSSGAALRENGGQLMLAAPNDEVGVALLQKWLKKRARQLLVPLVREESERFGLDFERVQIRLQRSRWGSCSVRGTISLNAKLVFLPRHLARYVVLHELAHVRHPDHSVRFWNFLRQLEPESDQLDAQLDDCWERIPRWASIV